MFRKQSVVDGIIDDIAYTFDVERKKLNVVAAAKGLVCGRMKIWYKTGDMTECWNDQDVEPLPSYYPLRLIACLTVTRGY